MASELTGTRVAFLTANEGVEQVELTVPWQAVKDAGGTPELIAPQADEVQAFNHVDKADIFTAHRALRDADPSATPRWCCRAARSTPTNCGSRRAR
jgi:protease I